MKALHFCGSFCSDCRGTGEGWHGHSCRFCHGKGYMGRGEVEVEIDDTDMDSPQYCECCEQDLRQEVEVEASGKRFAAIRLEADLSEKEALAFVRRYGHKEGFDSLGAEDVSLAEDVAFQLAMAIPRIPRPAIADTEGTEK